MQLSKEIKNERHIYYDRLSLSGAHPVYKVHRFTVFKLKIIKRLYSENYGEVNFLIQSNDNEKEKCIVYVLFEEPGLIHQIKHWRSVIMDKELSGYIIQAFNEGYLKKKFLIMEK